MASSKKKKKVKNHKREDDDLNVDVDDDGDGNIQDVRFQKAQTHPAFSKLHTKTKAKTKGGDSGGGGDGDGDIDGSLLVGSVGQEASMIDDRFKAVLTDSRFAMGGDIGVEEGGMDKYGRKHKKKKKKKKEKEGQVEINSDTEDKSKSNNNDEKKLSIDNGGGRNSDDDSNDKDLDEDEGKELLEDNPESRIAYLTALSRGEIDVSSSSSDEESSDDEGDKKGNSSEDDDDNTAEGSEDSIYGRAGVLDPSNETEIDKVEITFDTSKYIAVCNMDWSNVRAIDILAVVSSFSPPGSVKFVHVYPSDFGIERMEKDKMFGPVGVWKKSKSKDKSNDHDENQDEKEKTEYSSESDEESLEHGNSVTINGDDSDSETNDEDADETDSTDNIELDERYDNFQDSNADGQKESDFDAEKLREYEAGKLKYYFAVVQFTSSEAADVAYKELDGMEMGHSSANLDLRSIPESDVSDVVKGRECRDKASVMPSNYIPPDFVVTALQQTAVKCTWEEGDKERERLLTQYGVGNEAWNAMAEGDDLRAYLASDDSSEEEDSSDDEEEKSKGSNMRKLLGLDDSDDESDGRKDKGEVPLDDDESFFGGGDDPDSDDDNDGESKTFTFVPGKHNLEEKIRTKLKNKNEDDEDEDEKELTPWEKYQLKRKEKRKEKKRRAKEAKLKFQGKIPDDNEDNEGGDDIDTIDDFKKGKNKHKNVAQRRAPSSKEELDLLLVGDDDDEEAKDFHMRDLIRIEKNKSKKLRGSRKRKEQEIASNTPGLDFKIDTSDNRFAAVLEGNDERFGIDRTDPQYKETPAMRQILAEQAKRRKEKGRKKRKTNVVADVSANSGGKSSGALALSSLVKSLKSKVAKK